MTDLAENAGRRWSVWRILGWGFGASLLLAPAIAMQFTAEVNWTIFDFIFAAVLIGSVGLVFELAVRMTRNFAYRAGVGAALAAAFMIVWANGAVGMIGSEHNPYNLLFLGVIAVALLGSVITFFRPKGMALAMVVAAAAQACVALGGLSVDLRGAILSATFGLLWLLAAVLFRKAAREQGHTDGAAQA